MGRPSLIEAISATAARRVFARLPGLNCPQAQASTDGGLVLGCESQYPFRSLTAAGELCPIPLAVPIPRAWILASDGDVLWLVDQSNRFLKLTISTCEIRQMLHATPLLNRGQANGFTPGAPLEIFCNGFTIGTLPVAQAIGTILAVSICVSTPRRMLRSLCRQLLFSNVRTLARISHQRNVVDVQT